MTPHAPNIFALSTDISPRTDVDPSGNYIEGSNAHVIVMTPSALVDKKRARPPEETTRARKKVASELMAFEFESLSLSNTSVPGRSAADQPLLVQHQDVREQQHLQQGHSSDHVTINFVGHPRAEDTPVLAHRTELGNSVGSSESSSSMPSSSSSSPSMPRPDSYVYLRSNSLYTQKDRLESDASTSASVSRSSFSPLSPPVSPMLPAITTTADMSLSTDENMMEMSLQGVDKGTAKSTVVAETAAPSNVKILNMRQRKWNSARKEWQEWHDVQATHTPDIPLAPTHTTHGLGTSISAMLRDALRNNDSAIETTASYHEMDASQHLLERPVRNGKEAASDTSSDLQSQSSGLGRQRSLHESREKSKIEPNQENHFEQRASFGARARSFSETNIYPFPQHQCQQQQEDPHVVHAPGQMYESPYVQRAGLSSSQVTRQQPSNPSFHQHDPHSAHQTHRHSGHTPRHHSDNVYSSYGDMWERHADSEQGVQLQQTRTGQVSSGSAVTRHHQQQLPWMALSMTALDGTMNIPSDRFSRPALVSSPSFSSAQTHMSPVSPQSPLGSHLDDAVPWNQQLLKSQNGYRENAGSSRIGLTSASSAHYGQYHHHQHQHQPHVQEDVSMGEEAVRLMPSRSSSPSPCLSMAPTVTRPLSISFSQLAGSNMLGDLAEHEHDDDMEL